MVGVAVLAPFAALIRIVRGWVRGDAIRFRRERSNVDSGTVRVDVHLDLPSDRELSYHRCLTDTVVRIAENLHRPGDVYHLIARERGEPEAVLLPVGPQLQELGERFHLVLSQEALRSTTCVWLTLGPEVSVVDILDPLEFDPEAEGEPEALMRRSGMRWGMASSVVERRASVVVRIALFVPAGSLAAVESLLDRLRPGA